MKNIHNPDNQIEFTSSRIRNLMFKTDFDPKTLKGNVIVNISLVKEEDLADVLDIFSLVSDNGLCVSPDITIYKEGESLGNIHIEKGMVGIGTICSITIDGILLKAGIPVKPKLGGIVEIRKGVPIRFTDLLKYESTTIDPMDALMSQGLTSVSRVIETGSGKILANLREVHMVARDKLETTLSNLVNAGILGILEVGEPNTEVLNIPIERDHIGIVVIGGTNLMTVVQECGIPVKTNAMSELIPYDQMKKIEEFIE